MSFVAAASAVGAWAGIGAAGSTAAIIGGGAMIGAGVGGAYSALTGDGKILDSMLTGALLGGGGAYGLNAAGVGAGATATTGVTGATGTGVGATAAETAAASSPALNAYGPPASAMMDAPTGLAFGPPESAMMPQGITNGLTAKEMLGYGLGATTLMGLLGGQPEMDAVPTDKGTIRPFEFKSTRKEPEGNRPYYFKPIEYDKFGKTTKPIDTAERNYFNQSFTALPTYKAAMGGEVPSYNNMPAGGLSSMQGQRDGYGAPSTQYGNIPQFSEGGLGRSTGKGKMSLVDEYVSTAQSDGGMAQVMAKAKGGDYNAILALNKIKGTPNQNYAAGGQLGDYSDGGQLLKGPGDGVSDSIPASINKKQPARLADGEFVIPARIVSELGNGSTEAGAKRLYGMMDRVQADRGKTVGKGKVAVDSKARKHLPA